MEMYLVMFVHMMDDIPVSLHATHEEAVEAARKLESDYPTPEWWPGEVSTPVQTAVVTFRDGLAVGYELIEAFYCCPAQPGS